MKISQHLHRQLYLKNLLLSLLLLTVIALAAKLTTQYRWEIDVTGDHSNTLSEASQKLLSAMPDDMTIHAYIKPSLSIRPQIAQLVSRYQRYKNNLSFDFIDPEQHPEQIRELNIGATGAVIIEYQGRSETVTFIDETSLSSALLQLANAQERWITFLTGHGERAADGQANFDLNQFSLAMERRKIRVQPLNLTTLASIPDNAMLLVISAPTVPLLAGEIDIIKQYIQSGRSLLLLAEPGNHQLDTLEKALGIRQIDGVVVDTNTQLYGIDDPSFVVLGNYHPHPALKNLQTITLYPGIAALAFDQESDFQASTLFSSAATSWSELGSINKNVRFDADNNEQQGPLDLAYALTRNIPDKPQQRIIVLGDGDFLSNAYLGNAGNLDMGLRLINWLSYSDGQIDIPPKSSLDSSLQLNKTAIAAIGFGFLFIIPFTLLGTGLIIWRKRKQR
ncbi:MAG: GldG family protein [Methylococcaceae bacterium]|jgi:ABC-type uncharacterized transport system involved in gliding motility auxiliary subunit